MRSCARLRKTCDTGALAAHKTLALCKDGGSPYK